jgi:hypothetical protein
MDNIQCLGNENLSECLTYNGVDIPAFDIKNGDNLNVVLSKMAAGSIPIAASTATTTDDIVSTAKSSTGISTCGASIVNKSFTYSLAVGANSSVFTYDLTQTTANLPQGIDLAEVNVKAYGKTALIANTTSQSGGFNLKTNQYALTVDIEVRLLSECGNLVLKASIYIGSPSEAGDKASMFTVSDLNQSAIADTVLTDQLNGIDLSISNLTNKIISLDNKELIVEVNNLNTEIEELKVTAASVGVIVESEIETLQAEIDKFKAENLTLGIKVEALQSRVDTAIAT